MSESESVRLAKRLAEQEQCSRREAELHITAGNVQVDGKVVQLPETRVRPEQQVTLRSGAQPEAVPPVTLLMNKPAGYTQGRPYGRGRSAHRSEEHTSELQSQSNLVCRLLLEKKNKTT